MPYQPKQKPAKPIHPLRPKPITKQHRKLKNQPAYQTPEKDSTDTNTMLCSPTQNEHNQRFLYSRSLVLVLIKQLHSIYRFGKDTLYVCLQLLDRLKIQIKQNKCRLYAAALFQIVAKVHECRTPQFANLVGWGKYLFSREELVLIQSQILLHFDFKIPTALHFQSIKQIQQAVLQLQWKIESPKSFYNFQ